MCQTCIREETELPGESGGRDGTLVEELVVDTSCSTVAILDVKFLCRST